MYENVNLMCSYAISPYASCLISAHSEEVSLGMPIDIDGFWAV